MFDEWIVVVDADPYSKKQTEVCTSFRSHISGMGFIDCADADQAAARVCHTVERFPAFCHQPTNSCVYGFRDTLQSLNDLSALAPSTGPAGGQPSPGDQPASQDS